MEWKHITNSSTRNNKIKKDIQKRTSIKSVSSFNNKLIINYILQWGKWLKRKEFQKID